MMKEYLAHKREDNGSVQTIEEHLKATGQLAAGFACEPLRPIAEYAGRIHDIGKYRDGFQRRIRGISSAPCEHACIAAQEVHRLANSGKLFGVFAPLLEYCTAGHHSGLQNGRPTELSPEGSLHEALGRKADDIERQRALFAQCCEPPKESLLAAAVQLLNKDIPMNDKRLFEKECIERYAFLTRYIYSCLTDADFL
ncbi:MAG: CRISPR-associated endonuclease Cas3'', partial [Oscillospiraceae bacterium]